MKLLNISASQSIWVEPMVFLILCVSPVWLLVVLLNCWGEGSPIERTSLPGSILGTFSRSFLGLILRTFLRLILGTFFKTQVCVPVIALWSNIHNTVHENEKRSSFTQQTNFCRIWRSIVDGFFGEEVTSEIFHWCNNCVGLAQAHPNHSYWMDAPKWSLYIGS